MGSSLAPSQAALQSCGGWGVQHIPAEEGFASGLASQECNCTGETPAQLGSKCGGFSRLCYLYMLGGTGWGRVAGGAG